MSKLVAVVDDEPDIVSLITLHLEKAGFKVKGFLEADSFLKFIERQAPDLIVLDLMLPDADGYDICKYLKRREELSRVPLIMLTAKG